MGGIAGTINITGLMLIDTAEPLVCRQNFQQNF